MAKGDKVTVLQRVGELVVPNEIEVMKGGRTLEAGFVKEGGIQFYRVIEFTRGGTTTRTALFQVGEIVSILDERKEV